MCYVEAITISCMLEEVTINNEVCRQLSEGQVGCIFGGRQLSQ